MMLCVILLGYNGTCLHLNLLVKMGWNTCGPEPTPSLGLGPGRSHTRVPYMATPICSARQTLSQALKHLSLADSFVRHIKVNINLHFIIESYPFVLNEHDH